MRELFKQVAWALATAAMLIATPMQAAAHSSTVGIAAAAAATLGAATGSNATLGNATIAGTSATRVNTPAIATTATPENGRGWAELYCMGCVGLGTFALYSGGFAMLPVVLSNPSAFTTLAGSCLVACRSVLETLMQ